MPSRLDVILDRIRDLEQQLERELNVARAAWGYRFEKNRVRFERETHRRHRQLRRGIVRFLREASPANLLTAPVIYSLALPFVLLDLWVTVYQWVCFPLYGVARVSRRRYVVIDRHRLAYLNGIEKAHCVYCGYVNGLLAYVREVAARTEQYWCPIKHARPVVHPHRWYRQFADYGDAEGYHESLPELRRALEHGDPDESPGSRPPPRSTVENVDGLAGRSGSFDRTSQERQPAA